MNENIAFEHIAGAKIIAIEDEAAIRRLLKRTLQEFGAAVGEAETLRSARSLCASWRPDLILLDLGLPDGDGCDLIPEVRSYSSVPIVILSARDKEIDKVRALMAGADDYVTKPFGSFELLARIETQLRRHQNVLPDSATQGSVRLGTSEIDLDRHIFTRADKPDHLTRVEWRLLGVLLRNRGKVLTHRHLLSEVWGPNASEHTHYLRIYIQRLRNKIEPNPMEPRYILTEIGIGYRLIDDDQAELFSRID